MQLRRRYDKPEGWEPVYEGMAELEALLQSQRREGDPSWEAQRDAMIAAHKRSARILNAPPVNGVSVKHTGTHAEQNFKRQRVEEGLAQGWVSIGQGKLTIHAEEEDLVYTITRIPGTYCCHCGTKLDDDVTGASGKVHIAGQHAGAASPDPKHPLGWYVTNAYECVLDEAQHSQWSFAAVEARKVGGQPTEAYSPRRARARRNGEPTQG